MREVESSAEVSRTPPKIVIAHHIVVCYGQAMPPRIQVCEHQTAGCNLADGKKYHIVQGYSNVSHCGIGNWIFAHAAFLLSSSVPNAVIVLTKSTVDVNLLFK